MELRDVGRQLSVATPSLRRCLRRVHGGLELQRVQRVWAGDAVQRRLLASRAAGAVSFVHGELHHAVLRLIIASFERLRRRAS
jgi:hypothetical protein